MLKKTQTTVLSCFLVTSHNIHVGYDSAHSQYIDRDPKICQKCPCWVRWYLFTFERVFIDMLDSVYGALQRICKKTINSSSS